MAFDERMMYCPKCDCCGVLYGEGEQWWDVKDYEAWAITECGWHIDYETGKCYCEECYDKLFPEEE